MLNVLLFHGITKDKPCDLYSVTGGFLKELLIQVKGSFPAVRTLRDSFDSVLRNQDRSIALTFDDGWLSDYDIVLPLLKDFNFNASFFVAVNFIGKDGFMHWDMVKQLKDDNMEIGSHTFSHQPLSRLSEKRIWEELYASRCMLEDRLGVKIETVSFPHGDFNSKTIALAKKAGYRIICTSTPGINSIRQLQNGVLYRNSVNRIVDILNIPLYINPPRSKMLYSKLHYWLIEGVKKIMGIEGYRSVRDKLLSRKIIGKHS